MRKTLLQSCSLILLLFIFGNSAFAQMSTLQGKVTDSKTGESLIGVVVTYKQGVKTVSGATSDVNGVYSLSVGPDGTLYFSYLGYKLTPVPVAKASAGTLDVKMDQDIANLDEVVVTGLATSVKRSNVANDVTVLNSKQLTGVTVPTTFDAALTGKIPGSNIISNSGAPGGGINVRFRGVTSIFGNSQPLYVVDGVYFNNNAIAPGLNTVTAAQQGGAASNQDNASNRIADLNPDDIQSVEVLKGASAAAIYGSQAAAGVVIITTKRGQPGETRVTFSQDLGVISPRNLLGVRHFTEATALATYGANGQTLFQQAQESGKFYDYEKELFGNSGIASHTHFSISGGNEKTTYYVSGTYKHDDGIVTNTGYKAYDARVNLDQKISNALKFSYSGFFVNTQADRGLFNNDNKGVTLGISLTATPEFVDMHPVNGVYPNNPFGASNPLQTAALVTNNETVYRTTQSAELKANIFSDDKQYLNLVGQAGFDFYNFKTTSIFPNTLQFQSNGNGDNGVSIQGLNNNLSLNIGAFLVYYIKPVEKIDFTTSAGVTENENRFDGILNTAKGLIGNQTNVDQAGSVSADQTRSRSRIEGFFAQEEINYNDLFIATGSIRLDRSSDVGQYLKYVAYPKVSLAWNLNNMFHADKLDELKLRAAYGESGNYPPYGVRNTALFPSNIGGLAGSSVSVNASNSLEGNPDIKSERQVEFETGVDLSIYGGRLTFSGTYYVKTDKDLLLQAQVPSSSGFSNKWINGGTLQNKGVELVLGFVPVDNANVTWNSSIAFWLNRATVTKLDVPGFPPPSAGFGLTLAEFFLEQGESATQIKGISPTSADTVWGNGEPKFQMSFTEEIRFAKNFTFSITGFWKYDYQVINLSQLLFDLDGTTPDYDSKSINDPLLNPDGQLTNGQIRVAALGVTSKYFVQQAGYFRLREIGLYYTFPMKATSHLVKNVKVGISTNNYFTITNYKSYDPEVNNFGINGVATGIEVNPFPSSKEFYGHISIEF